MAGIDEEIIYWTTRFGRKVNIDEMSKEHLANTLKMLVKNDWINIVDRADDLHEQDTYVDHLKRKNHE